MNEQVTGNPVFRVLRVDSWNVLLSAIDVDVFIRGVIVARLSRAQTCSLHTKSLYGIDRRRSPGREICR
jgi:hypothetical protein